VIAVDWGTTNCRAYRVQGGTVVDRRAAPAGILHIDRSRFASTLRDLVGSWLAKGEGRVLLSGMIGSRGGWVETGYVPCPVSPRDLAGMLVAVPFDGAAVRLVPGVSSADQNGVPEFIRGEEAQVFGTEIKSGVICLPGSHSKWVQVTGGRIVTFSTFLTGEAFAALRAHTILARSIADGPIVQSAFDAGVARSADPGGVLHHLFGIRGLGLVGRLAETSAGSYLSGLLIGHEVRQAVAIGSEIHVVGASDLAKLYARAIQACGGFSRIWSDETAAIGINQIAECAAWT
jgi:2-dehydro-3-deoxygalactonokinase